MNIAWLTPEIPFPPIGGRNGVYNRIVQLSKYNQIYLYSIAYSEKEKTLAFEMEPYCKEVHYYNRNESKVKNIAKSILLPFSVATRTIKQLNADLKALVDKINIDLIIIDFPNMALNLRGIDKKIYVTLNEHNIEYARMRSMAKIKTISVIKRLAYYLESYRLEAFEKRLYYSDAFQSITFFSKKDMSDFQKKWKGIKAELRVFPLGANNGTNDVDINDKKRLLFIGRLDSIAIPNVEAAIWMAKKVFPHIKQSVPEVKLIIAGANPSDEVIALGEDEDIIIIPNYASMSQVYSLSDIVILPLLSGGGVKGKLLEAASFGKIIVSTDHGIEGTDFRHMEQVIVANSEEEFSDACVSILCNPKGYIKLAKQSNQLFKNEYEWGAIGSQYNEFLTNRASEYKL